ncbi:amidohydrolase family protein [Aquihabitans sp. G128]|uniref:amidohydrolase family protein n=1 Tax=Aquihabitans sp. G128 TaxID=2849779 RepID=UPI001C24C386|nr:amidohydrolase family protein [Aquihabitans sp. G128]QXC61849.1 amidohydrolase family protein [Aquihabitans sp. G128]
MTSRLLAGGVDADGDRVDVRVEDVTGTTTAVGPTLDRVPGEEVVDCTGLVVLPAAAEPHVHLDKVATIREAPNPSGELMGAVRAWLDHAPSLDAADVRGRALAAVDDYVRNGATAVRTNVNLHATIDLQVLEAILDVRTAVADRCELQVVGLFMPPLSGDGEVAEANRALIDVACELGIDAIGSAPVTDADPEATIELLAAAAVRWDRAIDLHIDETLDPTSRTLLAFAAAVERHGLGGRATAGHCVSLGMQALDEQESTAARLAEAGIAAVALPTTNLWLQGRAQPTGTPRGVTAVRRLLDAGVVVATGSDNIEDPFCPLGRADPFDAARLLSLTAHLSPAEAWAAASTSSRASLGLAASGLAVGGAADLVAVAGRDLGEALARGSARRTVLKGGRVVARTTVTTTAGA